jgi:hypothetical protein
MRGVDNIRAAAAARERELLLHSLAASLFLGGAFYMDEIEVVLLYDNAAALALCSCGNILIYIYKGR